MNVTLFLAVAAKIDAAKDIKIPTLTAAQILEGALNLIYFSAGAVAVVVIVLAGYTFSTAVYDPAKITQAKNALIYALVGLVVVTLAFAITQFIMRRF